MRIRLMLCFLGLTFLSMSPLISQSPFKQKVDASSTNLPYSEQIISSLKIKLQKEMLKDLGWTDKVTWVKGIVSNYSMGAIEAKCGTEKGEVLYFRTIMKDIDGEVQWDAESFSSKVLSSAMSFQKQKAETTDYYIKKLSAFDKSLYGFYKHKYDSTIDRYQIKLKEQNLSTNQYNEVQFYIPSADNFLEKVSEIIPPVDMYRADFNENTNYNKLYFEITSKAINEANQLEKELLENFTSEKEFAEIIDKIKKRDAYEKFQRDSTDGAKRNNEALRQDKIKQMENDQKRKELEEKERIASEIALLEKGMEQRLENVYTFVKKGRNKGVVNDHLTKSSDRQKDFFNSYLNSYDLATLKQEYNVSLINTAYKLDKLKYWDENLKYWEVLIK